LRNALELNMQEAEGLVDEAKALGAAVFVLTGGDPLKHRTSSNWLNIGRPADISLL